MNDKEIYKFLVEAGWREKYEREKLEKYYRFEVTTAAGKHYFYLDRDNDNARICMAPQFVDHVASFEQIPGVRPGLARKKGLLGKSSNMREFPVTTGRTGNDIPQFFPIAFQNQYALTEALKTLQLIVNGSNKANTANFEKPAEQRPRMAAPRAAHDASSSEESDQRPDEDIDSARKLKLPLEDIQQRAIRTRRGQPDFRRRLFAAYGSRCAITGCKVRSVLEAAHIIPHAKGTDWEINNGLPLRADIHTLFDLRLLAIDHNYRVHISRNLAGSDYEKIQGQAIHLPRDKIDYPAPDKLSKHFEGFMERESSK